MLHSNKAGKHILKHYSRKRVGRQSTLCVLYFNKTYRDTSITMYHQVQVLIQATNIWYWLILKAENISNKWLWFFSPFIPSHLPDFVLAYRVLEVLRWRRWWVDIKISLTWCGIRYLGKVRLRNSSKTFICLISSYIILCTF